MAFWVLLVSLSMVPFSLSQSSICLSICSVFHSMWSRRLFKAKTLSWKKQMRALFIDNVEGYQMYAQILGWFPFLILIHTEEFDSERKKQIHQWTAKYIHEIIFTKLKNNTFSLYIVIKSVINTNLKMLVMRFNTVQLLLEPLFRFLLQFLCFFQLLLKGGLFLLKKIDIINFSQHINRKLLTNEDIRSRESSLACNLSRLADLSFSTFDFTSLTTLTTSSATFLAYKIWFVLIKKKMVDMTFTHMIKYLISR